MPKPVTRLRDMEIDEVSVVDKGAAQDALIAIAKRADQEVDMPEEYYTEDGTPVAEDSLSEGDIVFDEEGNAYQYVIEDEGEQGAETKEQGEPVAVGKSAFAQTRSFSEEIREELSKAFAGNSSSADRELIAKAAARIDELETRAARAEQIAKSERDLRMTEEYISKAASYNLPGDPNELGPVLMRMAETMSYDDCAVINKALTAAGATIFSEIGYVGGGDNDDVMSMVEKAAGDAGVGVIEVFDENPDAYAEYLRTTGK